MTRLLSLAFALAVTATAHAQADETIRLNQTGMYPNQEKVAVIEAPKASKITIRDAATGKSVAKAKVLRKATSPWSSKQRTVVDFSALKTPGQYILSANGVSEEGYIVNIDGTGNRIAATVYGKKKVWFVVGKNKIVPTLEEAMKRADTTAAILNAKRFLPADAAEEQIEAKRDQICRAMTIHRKPMNGMVCEIVFVDEELGY